MATIEAVNIYAAAEIILSLFISVFNLTVIWVFLSSQHVRTATNTYIFSLALTDFLIGTVGIPLTVYTVLTRAPHSFLPCLAVHSILCVLCTISIFHLLAIAIDKYISICCKNQIMKRTYGYQRAVILIANAWIFGTLVSVLPLLWFVDLNSATFSGKCYFTEVFDYRYLVYVIFFGTIILPTLIIIFCYASIYSRIRDEEQQIKCFLRGRERERRIKGRKKLISILLLLVSTYGVCWYPLYTINTIDMFFPTLHFNSAITLSAVVLSHVSCAINPLIYAYGIPGFKQALKTFMRHNSDDSGQLFSQKSPLSGVFSDTVSPKHSIILSPRSAQHCKIPRKTSENMPFRTPLHTLRNNCDRMHPHCYHSHNSGQHEI